MFRKLNVISDSDNRRLIIWINSAKSAYDLMVIHCYIT